MGGLRSTCLEARELRAEVVAAPVDAVAVIVAGGSGERFGDPRGKQFVDLCGLPMAAWPILAFDRAPSVGELVVVCAGDKISQMRDDVLSRLRLSKPVTIALAGATRQESVYSGLMAAPRGFDLVAIHDAARPLVETALIERTFSVLRARREVAGAILAVRATNTLKLVEGDLIVGTPARDFYWEAQTPQTFRRRAVVAAHRAAYFDGYSGTDDASLVERNGGRVVVVESTRDNLKVTMPEDLAIAEAALARRLEQEGCGLDGGETL